jgi:hypothetical protein
MAQARVNIGAKQRKLLQVSFSEADIEEIETHHQGLVLGVLIEHTLKTYLDKFTDCSTFADAWHLLGELSTGLHDVPGGLDTVCPSAETVEPDFSLVEWEKTESKALVLTFLLRASCTARNTKQYRSI